MAYNIGGRGGGIARSSSYGFDPSNTGAGFAKKIGNINPFDTTKSSGLAKQGMQKAQDQYDEAHGVSEKMGDADDAYADSFKGASNDYLGSQQGLNNDYVGKVDQLDKQARDQAFDAHKTYSTISNNLKGSMEDAKKEASGAMTLQQAGDPNNSVQQAVRGMYNQQAQGVQKQGMADFGTMSALGAQAAGAQFGAAGGPMTSGTMGQIYGQGQQQAGNAYANAQQRMYGLQQQGIDQGFAQSAAQYDRGQGAKDRYRQSIGDVDSAESSYLNKSAKLRDERGGYAGEKYGVGSNFNADRMNQAQQGAKIQQEGAFGRGDRDLASLGQKYGYQQQGITNQIGIEEGKRQGELDTLHKEQENGGKAIGAAGSIGGAAASDERVKKNVGRIDSRDLDEFFHSVKPKTFDYKDPDSEGQAPGRRIGFMMQDVEDTKLGRQIMRRGPAGEKMYDRDNLNGIILAGLAQQARRSA